MSRVQTGSDIVEGISADLVGLAEPPVIVVVVAVVVVKEALPPYGMSRVITGGVGEGSMPTA
jgi:hypothetical protein